MSMHGRIKEKAALWLYNLVLGLIIPALRLNSRLADGFEQRTLRECVLDKADLWIQAASAGESYLAWSIIKNLRPGCPKSILITSNTRQGIEILKLAVADITPNNRGIRVNIAYFPFDRPAIMKKAVINIQPKVMVLLETEIWPGLLSSLKEIGCKIIIINGKLTEKSLSLYMKWQSFWHLLKPDRIFAVSEKDAERFGTLFGKECVEIVQNIKFDRMEPGNVEAGKTSEIEKIIPKDIPFLVLGSVRREEEPDIEKIILELHKIEPRKVVGLFPRHMHRIRHWEKTLGSMGIPLVLRSVTKEQVSPGTVVLWDTFGELTNAYKLSTAVFVGGTLLPVGGHNFLEPLMCGVIPVIGPFLGNFEWVGRNIEDEGLVRIAANWKQATEMLAKDIQNPPQHEKVLAAAIKYVKGRQGGTDRACDIIVKYLENT